MLFNRFHTEAVMNTSLQIIKNGLLLCLFALLLAYFKGPSLLYGSLSFILIATYHLATDQRFSAEQLSDSGLMTLHLAIYLLLCTLLIWATTGHEESHYWIIYFLPIVVAGTNLTLLHTLATCLFSSLFYLALIPNAIWSDPVNRAEDLPEFLISCTTFFIVGILMHGFSEQHRRQLKQQKHLNDLLLDNRNALQNSLRKLEEAEENLRRTDRLAALGEMSAGLAHEIRNPLGIIASSAQLLQNHINPTDSGQLDLLDVIREESTRLNDLVTTFLRFGRPGEPQLKSYQLENLIDKTVEQLRPVAEQHQVALTFSPAHPTTTVYVDADMIQQLLLNLLLNAIEACSEQGNVVIHALKKDNQAHIIVTDNGEGIAKEVLPTIFNPFFTTKDGGTGLGLATAHNIAQSHGGDIHVTSQPGHGSRFVVTLPLETH
ncbi:periplasmic sensor signal transduction histidine kinase [Desulfuromonas acetoxidans DSM 684]|uniref:histidine kinase n=2 Tax=Desulfuromonas acetoxidans TaxID=891 RepID=Q1JZC0_DESA6|nr:periplasmic sensor signal transduction histidine kinase [Desulfuromonas acetoxidans DSM 684]